MYYQILSSVTTETHNNYNYNNKTNNRNNYNYRNNPNKNTMIITTAMS